MKAIQGLIVALLLGAAAVVFNWIYLEKKAAEFQHELFLGIAENVKIRVGDQLEEEHFVQVPVPARYAARLKDYVFKYEDKGTVAGIKAIREYEPGDLVHREDYKTPVRAIKLKADERLVWIPVEGSAFVPSLVNPGDQVTFIFPRHELASLPVSDPESLPVSPKPAPSALTSESIGPFTIGALGTRLGDINISQGYRPATSEEGKLGIIVRVEGGQLEPQALRLLELTTGSNRRIAIALHPRQVEE